MLYSRCLFLLLILPLLVCSQNEALDAPIAEYLKAVEEHKQVDYHSLKSEAYKASPLSPLLDKTDIKILDLVVASPVNDYSTPKDPGRRLLEAYKLASATMGHTQLAYQSALLTATSDANQAAKNKKEREKMVIRLFSYYKQGAFEEVLKLARKKDPTNMDYTFEGLLHPFQFGRLYRYAEEHNSTAFPKINLRQYAINGYLNGVMNFYYLTISFHDQLEMFNEVQDYYNKTMAIETTPTVKTELVKTNLGATLSFFRTTFNKIDIEKTKELAYLVISLSKEAKDNSLYEDAIYSLERHKTSEKTAEFTSQEAFLLAALYQEETDNLPMALEIWLNYIDYYDYDIENKMNELFIKLAKQKAETLKPKVGEKAIAHVNHLWGVTQEQIDKKKTEEDKKKKQKEMGVDW